VLPLLLKNMNTKRTLAFALMAGLLSLGNSSFAQSKAIGINERLSRVPAAEMPAKAAELIKTAKARDRGTVTIEVVKAGLALNPMAAPALIGAIAKAVPDMASIAAGTAAEAQPKQATEIAKAAALAAPGRTGKVVASVCRAVPNEYKHVALGVAQSSPAAGKEILMAVASVFSELKPGIDAALASYGFNPPSVAAVLDSAKPVSTVQSTLATPSGPVAGPAPSFTQPGSVPTVAPPYVSASGTPTSITPSGSGLVPRGGRNYSSP
jgi:hypothetical protein